MDKSVLASAVVLITGIIWGVYWVPVRGIAALGLDGAWGTGAITLTAALLLLPLVLKDKGALLGKDSVGIMSVALGGAAFALYSIGFLYGKVALVVLLWFFSPVWSVLIAKYMLRMPVPRLRVLAIAVGLAGLFVMLGGDGGFPVPSNLGEWMAFCGGLVWAFATAGMRLRSDLDPLPSAFLFAFGAAVISFACAPFLEPLPSVLEEDLVAVGVQVLFSGAIWWVVSIAALMWAAVRLDPARVGILLMPEVVFGAVTAAILAGENLAITEIIGGTLVVLSGFLEVWPTKRGAGDGPHGKMA